MGGASGILLRVNFYRLMELVPSAFFSNSSATLQITAARPVGIN